MVVEATLDIGNDAFPSVVERVQAESPNPAVGGPNDIEPAVTSQVMSIDDEALELSRVFVPPKPLAPAPANLVDERSTISWERPDEAIDVSDEDPIPEAVRRVRELIELTLDGTLDILEGPTITIHDSAVLIEPEEVLALLDDGVRG